LPGGLIIWFILFFRKWWSKMPKRIYNKIKSIKSKSRAETQVRSKGGVHKDKKEKRIRKPTTNDYLDEIENDDEEDTTIKEEE